MSDKRPERITADKNGLVIGIDPVEAAENCGECAHSQKYRSPFCKICKCDLKGEDVPLGSQCRDWKEFKPKAG